MVLSRNVFHLPPNPFFHVFVTLLEILFRKLYFHVGVLPFNKLSLKCVKNESCSSSKESLCWKCEVMNHTVHIRVYVGADREKLSYWRCISIECHYIGNWYFPPISFVTILVPSTLSTTYCTVHEVFCNF